MKKLNKKEGIAVFVALAFVTVVFYGNAILAYINGNIGNNKTTMNVESGVETQDVEVGTGVMAVAGDRVTVHYQGVLTDGKVFDSSLDRNQPFTFILGTGQVIKGWDEGVAGMREGGKRRLVIAPDYGYGSQVVGPIPANSTLIFDVVLLQVEKPVAATSTAQ